MAPFHTNECLPNPALYKCKPVFPVHWSLLLIYIFEFFNLPPLQIQFLKGNKEQEYCTNMNSMTLILSLYLQVCVQHYLWDLQSVSNALADPAL